MNRTYRLKQKFPDSNEARAMPTVLDCSLEPILDSTFQPKKAFPHGSDPPGSVQEVTGLSWQPSWGTEHTYRSFRLDGIRLLDSMPLIPPLCGLFLLSEIRWSAEKQDNANFLPTWLFVVIVGIHHLRTLPNRNEKYINNEGMPA